MAIEHTAGPVVLVFGTRPEIIKLAPISWALQARGIPCVRVSSGQHPDLLSALARDLGLTIDVDLAAGTPGRTPSELCEVVLGRVRGVVQALQPTAVVVQGDTTTAFAAALAAFYEGVGVAHVEAGLRTGCLDDPWPEEAHRRLVAQIAGLHLAPTFANAATLCAEGIDPDTIVVVGNPVVDALHRVVKARPRALEPAPFEHPVVVTLHRRESLGAPLRARLRVLRAYVEEHDDVGIVFPVHPNPAVQRAATEVLGGVPRVRLVPPLDYPAFVELLARARFVVTDSGGIQEEAPALGTPVVIARHVTERTEVLQTGLARLAGTPEALADALRRPWPSDRPARAYPFGRGGAGPRIVDALLARWPITRNRSTFRIADT